MLSIQVKLPVIVRIPMLGQNLTSKVLTAIFLVDVPTDSECERACKNISVRKREEEEEDDEEEEKRENERSLNSLHVLFYCAENPDPLAAHLSYWRRQRQPYQPQ